MHTPPNILELLNLRIGYARKRHAPLLIADQLNAHLKQGQLLCLLGPNGAGKSTLMRTIAGMQPALGGQIHLKGQPIDQLNIQQLARKLSLVLTERPQVGLMSAYDLVALGRYPYTDWTGKLRAEDKRMIDWAIAAVKGEDLLERPFVELSDGQKQRFLLARALAQDPDLMLLDEPTAYLDLPRRVELMHLLAELAHQEQRTILLSTHDLDLALETADQLWLLADGQLIQGAPETLILNGSFERAFQSGGIPFDRYKGRFQLQAHYRIIARLEGPDLLKRWTQHALERHAYTVGESAPLKVSITGDENAPRWIIHAEDQPNKEYLSLETFLQAIEHYAKATINPA